jgi:hypothetical protein
VPGGHDPGCDRQCEADGYDASRQRSAAGALYPGSTVLVFQKRIADHEKRKAGVPDLVQPGRRLRAGIEQPGWGKHAGKRQGMDDRGARGEQISARKQQQRPRAQQGELRKQQD